MDTNRETYRCTVNILARDLLKGAGFLRTRGFLFDYGDPKIALNATLNLLKTTPKLGPKGSNWPLSVIQIRPPQSHIRRAIHDKWQCIVA